MSEEKTVCKKCKHVDTGSYPYAPLPTSIWQCDSPEAPSNDYQAGTAFCVNINKDGRCPYYVEYVAPPPKKSLFKRMFGG